jgi:hypothetical protein
MTRTGDPREDVDLPFIIYWLVKSVLDVRDSI